MKNNRLTILNIFLTILSCGLLLRQPTPGTEFQFASLELPQVSISGAGESTEPVFIQETGGPPSVHSGTLAELKDQTLLAAWFGGSREGARDVQIFLSRLSKKGGHWTPPEVIASREQTSHDLNRFIAKIGNPVLFADSSGRVWLFYVTVSFGGWSGSSISVRHSDDGGVTWSAASRLVTSPFLNVSTLVKGAPLECESGHIVLPVYHEFIRKFGETLLLDRNGKMLAKIRLTAVQGAIQPWIVPVDGQSSRAFYRQSGHTDDVVLTSNLPNVFLGECDPLETTVVPNPDSSIAVIRRHSGGLLMACNPVDSGRHRLSLATSRDGASWEIVQDIEQSLPPGEFSYPYLIRGAGGKYHLIYTWNRTRMSYLTFDEQWLEKNR